MLTTVDGRARVDPASLKTAVLICIIAQRHISAMYHFAPRLYHSSN